MSTRATYSYPDATIYIHHDGYEEGTAYYFYNAFLASGDVSATSMIRGNDRAEITDSHDTHGDTEYRYTIKGDSLTVEARHTLTEFGSYPEGWRTVFTGDWVDFVNKHINSAWLDQPAQVLRRVQVNEYGHKSVHTPDTLKALVESELRLLGQWAINGHLDSANGKGLIERIKLMQSQINKYGETEWIDQRAVA